MPAQAAARQPARAGRPPAEDLGPLSPLALREHLRFSGNKRIVDFFREMGERGASSKPAFAAEFEDTRFRCRHHTAATQLVHHACTPHAQMPTAPAS